MNDLIELVAMAPSADVFILRDPNGRHWLISPFDGEQVELGNQSAVDRAISMGDLQIVRKSFEAYSELGKYLDEQAALIPTTGIASEQVTSAYQAELLLDDALEWKSDHTPDSLEIARNIITRLLQSPPARADDALRHRLERELVDLGDVEQPAPTPNGNPLYEQARQRVNGQLQLAA